MSARKDTGGRRGYHHGNLREALVAAAARLIAEKGASGFTFAEVARAAGVSPAAPYRHFRDLNALMGEVARQGFERFANALEDARRAGGPSPIRAFEAVSDAYLQFAREERAFFVAMFQAGIPLDADPALGGAADRAFAALLAACEDLVRHVPEANRPPVVMMAYHVWAMSHGVAELFGERNTARRAAPLSPEEMLETGVGIYLRGLGVLPDD